MFLFILGIVVLVAGFAVNVSALAFSRFSRPSKVVGLILMGIGVLSASLR